MNFAVGSWDFQLRHQSLKKGPVQGSPVGNIDGPVNSCRIIHPSPFSKLRCVNADPSLKEVGKHRLRMSPFLVHDARITLTHRFLSRRSNTSMRATPSSQWRRFQRCRRCHGVAAARIVQTAVGIQRYQGWRCQSQPHNLMMLPPP